MQYKWDASIHLYSTNEIRMGIIKRLYSYVGIKVKQKTGNKHKKMDNVRVDNGTEFMGAFDAKRKTRKMGRGKSSPYQPQQQGKVERFNRTITDAARTMLYKVDKRFWPAAHKMAAWTWNRLDRKTKKSPYFRRYGIHPDLTKIKKFGCIAFFRNQDGYRRKLEDKYIKGVFIGYSETSSAYLIAFWDKQNKMQVAESWDCKFFENFDPPADISPSGKVERRKQF